MNIILLGAPGAGKGTQAKTIEKNWQATPLATGDLLRRITSSEEETENSLKLELQKIMAEGRLIPDALMIEILEKEIASAKYRNGFILDGFPRTEAQASALEKMLDKNNLKIDAVILLTIDEEVLKTRIEGRLFCPDCGASFHSSLNPPKQERTCDMCDARLEQRKDDNPETLRKRLEVFHSQTEPVLPFYEDKNLLIKIDGMRSIEEIAKDIQASLLEAKG